MSDEQQPSTDEVWLNRLAQRLGIEIAQSERLHIENEALRQRVQELTAELEMKLGSEHGAE